MENENPFLSGWDYLRQIERAITAYNPLRLTGWVKQGTPYEEANRDDLALWLTSSPDRYTGVYFKGQNLRPTPYEEYLRKYPEVTDVQLFQKELEMARLRLNHVISRVKVAQIEANSRYSIERMKSDLRGLLVRQAKVPTNQC